MLKLSNVAGFDFEKKRVLIKTGRMYFNNEHKKYDSLYEVLDLSDDEMQVIFDAWQDYKAHALQR